MRFSARVTLIQGNPLQAVVANHTAPQRVVKVQHQTLAGLSPQCGDGTQHKIRIQRQCATRKRQFGQMPVAVIMPVVQTNRLRQGIDIN